MLRLAVILLAAALLAATAPASAAGLSVAAHVAGNQARTAWDWTAQGIAWWVCVRPAGQVDDACTDGPTVPAPAAPPELGVRACRGEELGHVGARACVDA